MANGQIKRFTTLALSDQWIGSNLTYNEITSAVVGTGRTYDATDKTILGNWSSVEGSAAYDDGSGKQVIERFGGLNCALEQPILKLGDRVTGPDGLFYYVTVNDCRYDVRLHWSALALSQRSSLAELSRLRC